MTSVSTQTSLSTDDLIEVKARAHNSYGYGPYSLLNTAGALLKTIPSQVTTLSFDASTSTNT